MAISVFDLFKIGIGPSSSHTVGPMRAARMFAPALERDQLLDSTAGVKCGLYGSLGATGKGHGSDIAVMLGLMGHAPDTVDVEAVPRLIAQVRTSQSLALLGRKTITFREKEHLLMYRREAMAEHPNGMKFSALDAPGHLLKEARYLSVGGGFVVTAGASNEAVLAAYQKVPYPFTSGNTLLAICKQHRLSISQVMWTNERTWQITFSRACRCASGCYRSQSGCATSCSAMGRCSTWCCASSCGSLRKAYLPTAPARRMRTKQPCTSAQWPSFTALVTT